ncbi:MAG TPA: hypothetical protein HPP87_01100 [Planctomycetes bacterium]|nr:hypothetical protein [Planctomycetota bacterium]
MTTKNGQFEFFNMNQLCVFSVLGGEISGLGETVQNFTGAPKKNPKSPKPILSQSCDDSQ